MANISGKNLKGLDKLHKYSKGELLKIPIHSAKKICPERLNWPGRLAGIFEGTRRISNGSFKS